MNVAELIVEETKELGDISRLQVAPELAELLSILAHACRPRFAVEVGTFTGLSSLFFRHPVPIPPAVSQWFTSVHIPKNKSTECLSF